MLLVRVVFDGTQRQKYIKVGVNTNRVPRQFFAKAKKDVIRWHCHRVWLPTLPAGAIWPEHGGTERRRAPNVRQRPRRRRQRTKSIWSVLDDATCPLRGREWSVSVVSFHREHDVTVRRVGFYAKQKPVRRHKEREFGKAFGYLQWQGVKVLLDIQRNLLAFPQE